MVRSASCNHTGSGRPADRRCATANKREEIQTAPPKAAAMTGSAQTNSRPYRLTERARKISMSPSGRGHKVHPMAGGAGKRFAGSLRYEAKRTAATKAA